MTGNHHASWGAFLALTAPKDVDRHSEFFLPKVAPGTNALETIKTLKTVARAGILFFAKDPKDNGKVKAFFIHSVWNQALDFPDLWTSPSVQDKFFGLLLGLPKDRAKYPVINIPLSLFDKLDTFDNSCLVVPSLSILLVIESEEDLLRKDWDTTTGNMVETDMFAAVVVPPSIAHVLIDLPESIFGLWEQAVAALNAEIETFNALHEDTTMAQQQEYRKGLCFGIFRAISLAARAEPKNLPFVLPLTMILKVLDQFYAMILSLMWKEYPMYSHTERTFCVSRRTTVNPNCVAA